MKNLPLPDKVLESIVVVKVDYLGLQTKIEFCANNQMLY